jgi:hypothetical protein
MSTGSTSGSYGNCTLGFIRNCQMPGIVVYSYNLSLRRLRQEKLKFDARLGYRVRLCLKKQSRAGGIVQVLVCLPSKYEILSLNPSNCPPPKKPTKTKQNTTVKHFLESLYHFILPPAKHERFSFSAS